jgi:hypothetical protein
VAAVQPYPSAHISDGSEAIYTFDQKVPNEIVQLFFSYLKPDEIPTAAQVCRTWRTLASDFNLLKEVFYYSLPNSPQLQRHILQGRGVAYCAHLYQQLSSIPENVKCNRYVLRMGGYPEEASHVHFSEYGFCFLLPNGVIDIYDPISGERTATFHLPDGKESSQVCRLALSDLYLAIAYCFGNLTIVDRKTGAISHINHPTIFHLDFISHHLYFSDKKTGKIYEYDIQKAHIRALYPSLQFSFFQKFDNKRLIGISRQGRLFLLSSTPLACNGSDFEFPLDVDSARVVALSFDAKAVGQGIVLAIKDAHANQISRLLALFEIDQKSGDTYLTDLARLGSPFNSFLFQYGYLWIVLKSGDIIKIDPNQPNNQECLLSLNQESDVKSALFWCSGKLYIYTLGQGMCVLDFCATSQDIISDIASSFVGDRTTVLFQRWKWLSEEQQERILDYAQAQTP